jgi:chemotaxis protein histidine kinase CheA
MAQAMLDKMRKDGTFTGLDQVSESEVETLLEGVLDENTGKKKKAPKKKEKRTPGPATPERKRLLVPWEGDLCPSLASLPRKPSVSIVNGQRVVTCAYTGFPIQDYVSLPLPVKKNGVTAFQMLGAFYDNNCALSYMHLLYNKGTLSAQEFTHHHNNLKTWLNTEIQPAGDASKLITQGGPIGDLNVFIEYYAAVRNFTGARPVVKPETLAAARKPGAAIPKYEHYMLTQDPANKGAFKVVEAEDDEENTANPWEQAVATFPHGFKAFRIPTTPVWLFQASNVVLPKSAQKVLKAEFSAQVPEAPDSPVDTRWHVVSKRKLREQAIAKAQALTQAAEVAALKEKNKKRKEKEKALKEKLAKAKAEHSKAKPKSNKKQKVAAETEPAAEAAEPPKAVKKARKQATPKRSLTKKTD